MKKFRKSLEEKIQKVETELLERNEKEVDVLMKKCSQKVAEIMGQF